MVIELVMLSNHLILCHCLHLLPSIFPSIIVFSDKSTLLISWPNEYSGLISYRIDWYGLLAVQRTLTSLSSHHSLKASILQCSVFFMVQLSHPYMTYWKNQNFDYSNICHQSDRQCLRSAWVSVFQTALQGRFKGTGQPNGKKHWFKGIECILYHKAFQRPRETCGRCICWGEAWTSIWALA